MTKTYLFALSVLFSCITSAQYTISIADSNQIHTGTGVIINKTSFRGLSIPDDHTIWASGSRGTIARSTDGGKTFQYAQIKGYEKSDFRDIEAFDGQRAVIMSSGAPAYILKTMDGGKNWKEVYKNTDTAYFLDAMDFWDDQRGILVGDPINGHFVLLQTNDGGNTWQQADTVLSPAAMYGESIFAASGTSLRCWENDAWMFVSNRAAFIFQGYKLSNHYPLDLLLHAGASSGAFSMAKFTAGYVIVGGDYRNDRDSNHTSAFIRTASKKSFSFMPTHCYGYRSCVEVISKKELIACGTSGVDIFEGASWKNISRDSFHVVRKAKKGKAVFLAGPDGKIGKLSR